ncbi:MAG: PQQ-dependent sugar dehydrogenase [Thermodesulfobacteriota bacterium]
MRGPVRPFARAILVVLSLSSLAAGDAAAGSLSFLSPPEGAEMRLELVRRFEFDAFPDLSTGTPQPPPGIAPSDLEFFPDRSGESLLLLSTGTVAWLGSDFSLRGAFAVPSANSLAQFQRSGEFHDNEGALGLAFDPGFAANRWFYVHLNAEPRGGVQIWRLTWDPANLAGIWDSRFLVLDVPKPQIASDPVHLHNHDGGNPLFGPDGKLYVLLGDGGIGGEDLEDNQAQSLQSSWGKVLRVDPTGAQGPVIVARGVRNPFTSTFFGDTLVIGDVGADDGSSWEEVNVVSGATSPAATPPNFGWPLYQGPCWAFAASAAECADLVDPIHGYRKDDAFVDEDPDATPGPPGTVYVTALVVGPVYSGGRYDGYLDDVLLYSDFVQGWVRGALLSEDGRVLADRHLLHYDGLIPGLVKGPDGFVYLLGNDLGHVEIHRLTGPNVAPPPEPPVGGPPLVDHPTDPMPKFLSDTGFFPAFPALTPLPRAVRFTPQFALWSDGADKRRFLVLPPGSAIDTADPERWTFPVGTLVVKHFGYTRHDGTRREIETRVLQKGPEGWRFGTYVWNDEQTEATLSDGRPVDVPVAGVRGAVPPSFTYEIPGGAQCRACHARQADVVIGFEPMQLGTERVRTLEAAGVLATPHEAAPPTVAGADWLDGAARGYLHANCAHCHSAEGGLATMLGFSLEHRETESAIGLASRRGRGTLIEPGDPGASALLLMLAGAPDLPRMPPLGPHVVDLSAVSLVSEWIRGQGERADAQHPAGRDLVDVVELYHPDEDRYLLAATAEEAAAVEAALGPAGWRRTGYGFQAWRRPATSIPGPRAVVRAAPQNGIPLSSLLGFRSVPSTARGGSPAPRGESSVAFYLYPPEDGGCASGFDPVYRTSIRRAGSLQLRYTTSFSVYQAMAANGWRTDGVAMCAPR